MLATFTIRRGSLRAISTWPDITTRFLSEHCCHNDRLGDPRGTLTARYIVVEQGKGMPLSKSKRWLILLMSALRVGKVWQRGVAPEAAMTPS
uniref:Uncharacterized protein n=1 Tax=Timema poppense TaxID=170557 RepID=A0A7R9H906_TIMPO|nr:unnamed protein product [Timema poppensis]